MKRVILEEIKTTVSVADVCSDRKAYCFCSGKTIYKLHRIKNEYAFVSLDESECYANGHFVSAKKAIKRSIEQGYEIYEINNTKDLIKFLEEHN